MKQHAGILQHGVQALAIKRHVIERLEWIGHENQQKSKKEGGRHQDG